MDTEKENKSRVAKTMYRDTLDKVSKDRYVEKIKILDDKDPYEIAKSEWSNDLTSWPEVTYPDIVNYLVYTQSAYTLQELRAYKSLDAYNYFVCGWVVDIGQVTINGRCVVAGKVKHSQRINDTCLQPWVICEKNGTINSGHCTCMAGVGEICSHIGALLFAVEAAVKLRNSKAVTEEKSYWLPTPVKKLQFKTIQEIDFTSARTKKKLLDKAVSGIPAMPLIKKKKLPIVTEPTSEELSELFASLDLTGKRPVFLSLVPGYAHKYRPKALGIKYSPVLTELYQEEFVNAKREDLMKCCEEVLKTLCVTPEECTNCEKDTRGQSSNKQWFNFRAGRLTASRIKSVCHTSTNSPSKSLIRQICYPSVKGFTSEQTEWGCKHEKTAKSVYIETMRNNHKNFSVRESGLVINPSYPFMGATPDGVASCDCCGEMLLEIKCPFCAKDSPVSDSVNCLETVDGQLKLKTTHAYYYQIQCQLLLCEKEYCDFMVWTNVDTFLQRISFDADFCQIMVEKSKTFFQSVILPELVGKSYSRPLVNAESSSIVEGNNQATKLNSSIAQNLICVCQKVYVEDEDVIGCDNSNCPYVWLHFKCVKLKRVPNGDWYCPVCRKLPQFKKK